MKKIAVLQSNYIPWKGYFDIIHDVDEFIIGDDVQYTKGDWRNRNQIKTPDGLLWLTIPVLQSGRSMQSIKSVEIKDKHWARKHLDTIKSNYSHAPYFSTYKRWLTTMYQQCEDHQYLSRINHLIIKQICETLGINTKITWSCEYELVTGKTERLISLCKQSGATYYLTGPAAKSYIDENLFKEAGIQLLYKKYNYIEYHQLYGEFIHNVSILDLIFNEGPRTTNYIWNSAKE